MARLIDEDISKLIDLHTEIRNLAINLGLSQIVISASATESHSLTRLGDEVEHLDIDITEEGEDVHLKYVPDR